MLAKYYSEYINFLLALCTSVRSLGPSPTETLRTQRWTSYVGKGRWHIWSNSYKDMVWINEILGDSATCQPVFLSYSFHYSDQSNKKQSSANHPEFRLSLYYIKREFNIIICFLLRFLFFLCVCVRRSVFACVYKDHINISVAINKNSAFVELFHIPP